MPSSVPSASWSYSNVSSSIDLTEPIDVYSEWIDAADAAQRDEHVPRRTAASSSNRPVQVTGDAGSDDDE